MSIENAFFAVQRGDELFKCKGSELKDKLEDGDKLVVQRAGVTSKFVVDGPKMPWHGHNGGIFHVKNASGTVKLSGGQFDAWNIDGTNQRKITSFNAGEELVFLTSQWTEALFINNATANWEFGRFTNTSNVTDMESMFNEAKAFNSNISGWDTSKVTNMSNMFQSAIAFDQDISGWDTSNVVNMYQMFYTARVFNQDISSWDTNKVTNMGSMFKYAAAFNQDISQWCVSKIGVKPSQFDSVSGFEGESVKQPQWGTCPRGEDL